MKNIIKEIWVGYFLIVSSWQHAVAFILIFAGSLILCLNLLLGAQKITIPVGTTPFGPIAVSALHKFAEFTFDRSLWTNPNSFLDATMDDSIDKGVTWAWMCNFKSRGGPTKSGSTITSAPCEMRKGATHIRGTAIVTGGEIVLKAPPNIGGKP